MKCMPSKFLCCLPLKVGAVVVGLVTLCILVVTAIVLVFQVAYASNCFGCDFFTWRNCYAYSISAFVYTVIMVALNLWYFYGIDKNKSSVVVTWIGMMAMWLGLLFVLLIVLLSMYVTVPSEYVYSLAPRIIAFICGLVVIGILLYGWVIILAFWTEMKESNRPHVGQTA